MRQAVSPPFAVTPAYQSFWRWDPLCKHHLATVAIPPGLDTIPCDAGKLRWKSWHGDAGLGCGVGVGCLVESTRPRRPGGEDHLFFFHDAGICRRSRRRIWSTTSRTTSLDGRRFRCGSAAGRRVGVCHRLEQI